MTRACGGGGLRGRRRAWPCPTILFFLVAQAAFAHDVITTNLTWTQEISRIVFKHCASCHGEGSSIPLMTYEQARPWAKAIRDEVMSRRMPPWGAVKGVGEFKDDPSLSQPEIDMIVGWVEGGAPNGNEIYLTAAPHIDPPDPEPRTGAIEIKQSMTLSRALVVVGVRPLGAVQVSALKPDGAVEHLIWARDLQKPRSYYFREPVRLPAGTQIVVFGGAPVVILTPLPAR